VNVFCWDLDRTYLDTDIHSVRGMVRAAFEDASEKRHIPGAAALLRSLLAFSPDSRAAILSGSPTQLRPVLAARLAQDGIKFDTLVLKDNLGNLRRGRLRAIKGQLGYKLPHLLAQRLSREPGDTECLFGDDAEVDALIYTLYAEAIQGTASADVVSAVMRAGGAYEDQIEHALRSLERIRPAAAVTGIYIHVDRALPLSLFELLGHDVRAVFSWLQAAFSLFHDRHLDAQGVDNVVAACVDQDGLDPRALASLVQDAVRRGLVPAEVVVDLSRSCATLAPVAHQVERAVLELKGYRAVFGSRAQPDWFRFLDEATRGDLAGRVARGYPPGDSR
jgi:hypothetical protein